MKKILISIFILFLLTGCGEEKYKNGEVNVLNWSSYIPDSVIKDFENEYDIKVNYGTYSSNEELLAKVTNSREGTYDLVFPSDYMVELMRERGILDVIDMSRIENASNIDKVFLGLEYDKYNEYSLPFLMTYVVMVVDKGKISEDIDSYSDLLNENYKNNIVLLDDQRIVIGMGLKTLGYDMNGLNENNYSETKEFLLNFKKNVKAFDSDSPKSFLITDEVDIGVMWHAEALLAKRYNSDIEMIIPSDGYAISIDNYSLLKGSKNRGNAYKLINYLLREDINKRIIDDYPYIGTVSDVNSMPSDEIYSIIKNGSYVKNIGFDIKYYDNLWAEIGTSTDSDINFYFWFVQALGIIAWLILVASYYCKNTNKILVFQTVATAIYCLHYYLLGAYSGSYSGLFICCFEVIRDFLYYKTNWDDYIFYGSIPVYIIYGIIGFASFVGVFPVCSSIIDFASFVDVLPICSSIIDGYSLTKKRDTVVVWAVLSYTLWVIYDIFVMSYSCAITDGLVVISNLLILFRESKFGKGFLKKLPYFRKTQVYKE